MVHSERGIYRARTRTGARGRDQLGFVATSVATETARGA
jgi:hypothetical protein